LEQQRVDTEEICGKNAPGLYPQELPPAWPVAGRSGIDASLLENRPHGTSRNLVAKPSEFAVDPPVTQEQFSVGSRSTNRRSSGAARRPPLRWPRAESSVASPSPGATARSWPGRRSDAVDRLGTTTESTPQTPCGCRVGHPYEVTRAYSWISPSSRSWHRSRRRGGDAAMITGRGGRVVASAGAR
jgi:hypothetical protein